VILSAALKCSNRLCHKLEQMRAKKQALTEAVNSKLKFLRGLREHLDRVNQVYQ
jgi:hypothetical protein